MDKIQLYIKESYHELMEKVTWPTWSELQKTTSVVIVASLIFVLIIFIMDGISSKLLMDILYK